MLANSNMSDDELRKLYENIKTDMGIENENLDTIFQTAMLDRSVLFPNQQKKSEEECLRKWIKNYVNAMEKLPSEHIGEAKQTCSDPALATIIKIARKSSKEEIEKMETNHNLFMSTENIQGRLLEEYIANNIESYGWVWCAGNTLRAVDFCKQDGSALLQVKNKYNTENSSSTAIRNGTKIEKWYRLKAKKKNNAYAPHYRWDELNNIINSTLDENDELCNMSEEDYQKFLERVVEINPNIV